METLIQNALTQASITSAPHTSTRTEINSMAEVTAR